MIRHSLILLVAIGLDVANAASPPQVVKAQATVRCEAIDTFGFAEDGSRLAYSNSLTRSVIVVRCETGQPVATLSGLDEGLAFSCIVFSNDGERLAICSNTTVAVYQLPSFLKQKSMNLGQDVYAVAIPRHLDFIAIGRKHEIELRDLLRRQDGQVFRSNANRIHSVAVSNDGEKVALTARRWDVAQLWDTTSGKELPLEGTSRVLDTIDKQGNKTGNFVVSHGSTNFAQVVFSSDGLMLAAVGAKSIKRAGGWSLRAVARVWEARTGNQVWEHESEEVEFYSAVAFDPNNDVILLAGGIHSHSEKPTAEHYRVSAVDLVSKRTVLHLVGHTDAVRKLEVSPNGKTVATLGDDGYLSLWKVSDHQ